MKKSLLLPMWLICLVAGGSAFAQVAASPDIGITNTVTASIVAAAGKIAPQAVLWLGSFMAIQFVMTNFALLKSGADIEAVFGKLIGSLAWFGFCIYLLNNGPGFIQSVGGGILNNFASNIPTPGSIIAATMTLVTMLIGAIIIVGTSLAGFGNSSLGLLLVYMALLIWAIGIYFAVKIILLYVELALIVALAPLSFSLLGLNALKDQGIAPLKSLLALIYRIILLGILCTAFTNVYHVTDVTLHSLSWSITDFAKGAQALFAAFCAYPILAFLVYKSDSIAASLAGGGSGLGTGDVASSAAAGAAAGAAIGAASGSLANLASKSPGNIPTGGPGSIEDRSPSGSGGQSLAKPPEPMASLGSTGSPGAAPHFPTNKAGAPQQPEHASDQGTPAQSPADAAAAKATEERSSAEAAQSAGSGANAGIEGSKNDKLNETLDALNANLSNKGKRTLGDHFTGVAQSHAQEKAQTNVSISPHHE